MIDKILLTKEPIKEDPEFVERRYARTPQGANTFQSTYQWRDPSDQVRSFLITLSAFPGMTIGRIDVFSIDASRWGFLHDYYAKDMEVSHLERKNLEDIGSWKGKTFTFQKQVLEKVIADEEKLLKYARMLYGG